MKEISVAILHANSTFRLSLTKVLNCLGFNCIPIKSQYREKVIEDGQKWIHQKINQFQEGILLLHLDPHIDASVSYTAQDLIGWISDIGLQIPIVLMKPNYLDSQQDNVLNCPTCNNAIEVVSYPVELSKLLKAIHKASATKGLPQHKCLGVSLYNSKRHNIRLRYFIGPFIHNEILKDVPKIIAKPFDKDFCKNLWCEFYGKVLNKMSEVFDSFHFDYQQILPEDDRNKLTICLKKVEQILSDEQRDVNQRLEGYTEETKNSLKRKVFDNQLDYEINGSVLEHYDEDKAFWTGDTFNEKEVLSELKTKVTQLQVYFKNVKQDYKAYWQCRFETEKLLINLDIAPAFYFLDEVKNTVKDKLIDQQTKMLKKYSQNFTKEMAELKEYYQLCMKLLEDKLKFTSKNKGC